VTSAIGVASGLLHAAPTKTAMTVNALALEPPKETHVRIRFAIVLSRTSHNKRPGHPRPLANRFAKDTDAAIRSGG